MPVGKKDESAHCGTQKPWKLRFWGFFNNVFGTMPPRIVYLPYIDSGEAVERCFFRRQSQAESVGNPLGRWGGSASVSKCDIEKYIFCV